MLAKSSFLNGSSMCVNANWPKSDASAELAKASNEASLLSKTAALSCFLQSLSSCASLSASSKRSVRSSSISWKLCSKACCSSRNLLARCPARQALALVRVDLAHQRVGCFVDVLERCLSCNVDLLADRVAMFANCQLGFVQSLGKDRSRVFSTSQSSLMSSFLRQISKQKCLICFNLCILSNKFGCYSSSSVDSDVDDNMGVGQRELLSSLAVSAAVAAAVADTGALCVEAMVSLSSVDSRTLWLMLLFKSIYFLLWNILLYYTSSIRRLEKL